jgi:hypothetical protein
VPSRSSGARRRNTTTERQLGWDHQQNRDRLLLRHVDGKPCWWCGRPMFRDADRNHDHRALHADHTQSRSRGGRVADRLLHASCNGARGDGSRDHERPAAGATGRDRTPGQFDLGDLAMDWPPQ